MVKVSCAIIVDEEKEKILIAQRSETMSLPLKWEFPGGKVKLNESLEESLIREIKEELNLNIKVNYALSDVIHHYPKFSIQLFPFVCQLLGGDLKVLEHKEIKWISKEELLSYDWAEADLPIVNEWNELWV